MKLALTLLLIGTTLGTGSAAFAGGQGVASSPRAALSLLAEPGATLTLIDSDEDDDEDKDGWLWPKSDGDDDDCEEEHEEEDDDDCAASTNSNAAAPGPVAPPKNGLFTNGTAPVVKSN